MTPPSQGTLATTATADHEAVLRKIASRRHRAQQRLAAVEEELLAAVEGADAAGVPRRYIARAGGLAIATVYKWLGLA